MKNRGGKPLTRINRNSLSRIKSFIPNPAVLELHGTLEDSPCTKLVATVHGGNISSPDSLNVETVNSRSGYHMITHAPTKFFLDNF